MPDCDPVLTRDGGCTPHAGGAAPGPVPRPAETDRDSYATKPGRVDGGRGALRGESR